MTSINKLTQNKSANADDLVPIWDAENQRTRSLSIESISEFVETSDGKYITGGVYKDGNLTLNYNNGGGFTVQGFAFKSTQLKDMPSTLQPGKTLVVNQSGDGYELTESGGSGSVTEGTIPKKGANELVDSPMTVDESGNVKMSGSFTADELITNISSLNLGDQKKISGLGEGVEIHDLSRDRHKFIVTQWLDKDEDTSAFQYEQSPYALINIQPDFSIPLNNPEFTFETSLGDQILYGFEVKVNETQNNCIAQIFRHTELLDLEQEAKPIWEETFNNVESDTLVLSSPVVLDGNTKYDFKITGEFLGNAQGKMYYSIGTRLATKQDLVGTDSGLNVESVVAGNKIAVNNDDPKNPIISWAPGGEQFLPGVNVSQGGKPVEDAADTLDFADDQFVLTTNNKGQVQIELGETGPGTNVVGLFESTVELLAEYPNPADGLYAYVLQGDGKYPDDRYESKGGNWVGMGGITGETVVDDDKYKSLIMGDGLKVDDSEGSATISTSGNTPVLTFDVTADSTRSVDSSFVGKLINIIQTPPSISIPMQITLVDHSLFETGDTIKIAADRDGDNAYSNYYFAVYFNDGTGRNIAKYPANNITMVRTDTAWDVQLDGRFTNVSIRPKAQFNIPYAPDEQYNTPVNAFVFAESPAVEFEVDEDTNTRIVKLELDKAIPDNPTFKTISIDTNGSGQPNFTAEIKQDSELHTVIDATRELRINYKDIGTGATTAVLGVDNNQAQFLVPIYQGNDQVALAKDVPVIPDNGYIEKYTRADTDYIQVAYQGKYGDDKVFSPATFNQDNNGWTFLKFTGYMKFQSRDKITGTTGNDVLELRNDRVIHKQEPYYNDKKLAVQKSDVEFTKLQVQRSGRDFPPVSLFVDGYMNTIMEANGEFKFRYLDADGNATQTLQASTSKWNFLARPKYNNVNLVTNNEVYDIINDAIEPGSGISANSIRVARVTGYTNNYTSISYTDDKIQDVRFGKDNALCEIICYANSKLAYVMIHKDNVSASIGRDVDDGDLTLGINPSSDIKISIGKYNESLPTPVDDGVVAKISYNFYAMTMKLDNANQDANEPTQFLKSDGTITNDVSEAKRMGYAPLGLTLNQSFNGREWGHSLIRGYIKSDKTFEADITSPYYVMAVVLSSSLTLTKQHTAGLNAGSFIFYNNPLDASLDQNPLARIDDVNENENIVYQQQFKGKSGYDALISGGGSTKTVTYGDNGKILKISNATVKVELLQGMNSEDRPHGYFKYINSHNADVAFEWYDRAGNRISNNVPSVCPKDTVVEVFADYAKDEYVLNFSQSKVISSVSEEKVQQIVSKSFDSLLEPGEGTQPFSKHPLPNQNGYLSTYSSVMYDDEDRLVIPRNAYDRTLIELFFEANNNTAYCTLPVATVELLLGRILNPEDIELGIALESSTRVTPGLYSATTPSNVPSTWAWNGKFIPLETEVGEHNDPNNPSVWLSQDGDYVYNESEAGNKPKYDSMGISDLMSKNGQTWRYALRRGYIMKDGTFVFDAESPYYAFVIRVSGYQTPQSKIHTVFFNAGGLKLYPDAISAYMDANKLAEGIGTIINEMVTDDDLSKIQPPKKQSFINISDISVDYPSDANGEQYRPNNVVVMVLDTSNMISGLNITVTSSDSYAGHYNSVGSVCIDEHGEWSSQSNVNAYRLNDGTDTYCVFSKATGSWVLVVADVDHNNNGSLVGGSPVNLYNDGQLPESYGDYSIQNDLESIESEYFTQADVDIDYHTNSDANSYFNVSFGTAKPAGVIFYK